MQGRRRARRKPLRSSPSRPAIRFGGKQEQNRANLICCFRANRSLVRRFRVLRDCKKCGAIGLAVCACVVGQEIAGEVKAEPVEPSRPTSIVVKMDDQAHIENEITRRGPQDCVSCQPGPQRLLRCSCSSGIPFRHRSRAARRKSFSGGRRPYHPKTEPHNSARRPRRAVHRPN
jgi:hypothetical protein